MRMRKFSGWVLAAALFSLGSLAVMFTWTDPDGSYHATDQPDRLPAQYRSIVRYDTDHYVTPAGVGFERDENGNFRFFDHSSQASQLTRRNPPPDLGGPPGAPVSPEQLAEIKRRYRQWGGEPRPEVVDARVKRIISADTFEIDGGQKVTFIGIEFPDELKGETRLHQEVTAYLRRLMQDKTVHIIYGKQKMDDKGRLLAYVFIGTDMFVNADLVMNGYARVRTVPPNVDYRGLFLRLEDFARKSGLGLWATGAPAAPASAPAAPH
jgi:endonuclease YncB( thermonuclease family)